MLFTGHPHHTFIGGEILLRNVDGQQKLRQESKQPLTVIIIAADIDPALYFKENVKQPFTVGIKSFF